MVVKPGESPFALRLDNGTTVYALYALQVDCISLQHENEDIVPREFDISTKTFNFQCRMTVGLEELFTGMRGEQFPVQLDTNCKVARLTPFLRMIGTMEPTGCTLFFPV